VGSMVGMLAKNVFGCTVIGSAGGPEKCKMVVEKFGFDACVDYREAKGDASKLVAMVTKVAPKGIDTYFDNVGGFHFEAATALLRPAGRIALCGAIAAYNDAVPLPANLFTMKMIYTGQRIEGFVCSAWLAGKRGAFYKEMPQWVSEGKIVVEETRFKGVENWAVGFQALFEGKNTGKVVVDIAPAVQIKVSSSRRSSKSASKRSSKRTSTKTKSRDE
jgi:NADPH-dependent curcumin reductase CurA